MKTDHELRHDVERELEWEPSVDERRIGVSVVDGIVTLTGETDSYAEKWQAERTVERVSGVKGIANEIEVRSPTKRSDTEIAQSAVNALTSNVMVPSDHVTVKIDKGWLTLRGEVRWDYERRAAERAVRNLPGVKGISNQIVVRPLVQPKDVKEKIEDTFKREATYDANRISVQVSGRTVTLRGSVRSWAERHAAEKAALAAPGVSDVINYLTVDPAKAVA
jgi:osmotically-inducible protein OsmY